MLFTNALVLFILFIMKTNRQNKTTFTNTKHYRFNTFVPPHLTNKNNHKPTQRHTLASIFNQPYLAEVITLVCQEKIVINFQSKNDHRLQQEHPHHSKNRRHNCSLYSTHGQSHIMKRFFSEYEINPQKKYVFAADRHHEQVKQFRISQGDTKGSSLSKTCSEKELKTFLPLPKQPNSKGFHSKIYSDINVPQENRGNFKQCLSQKTLGAFPRKDEMFTVEELKESIQSEIKQSLKSHRDKENFKDINRLQNDFWTDARADNNEIEMPGLISFAVEDKDKREDLKITKLLLCQSNYQKQRKSPQLSKEKLVQQNLPEIRVQECQQQQESGLSLTNNLRKGLIQGSCSESQSLSFKIAGDLSIQGEKRKKDELQVQQISQIDQLSSIISNARQDLFKKETEQQQLDSIRCEIQDLNRCIIKNPQKPKLQMIQKLDLNQLAHQREQGLDSNIEISQKVVNPQQNISEFMVKYNVRFLPKKSEQTEIVRLSPLRFRKKEEVVHSLLKAKIIPKQSDSINIT